MSLQREASLRLDGSKTVKPREPRVRRLMHHFGDLVEAVEAREFSRAIAPRNELADAGFEIVFQRRARRPGGES